MSGHLEPAGYAELLEQLKARVRTSQVRAARAVTSELLQLYWSVGRDILDRQEQAGWGSRVIDRLATDLRAEFPDQRGWSRCNLHHMRSLAAAWPNMAVVPQAVGQLPWGHVHKRGPARQAQHPSGAGLVRRGRGRVRVVPGCAGSPGRGQAGRAGRAGAVEFRGCAADAGLRVGAAAGARPVRVRPPGAVRAGRGARA